MEESIEIEYQGSDVCAANLIIKVRYRSVVFIQNVDAHVCESVFTVNVNVCLSKIICLRIYIVHVIHCHRVLWTV